MPKYKYDKNKLITWLVNLKRRYKRAIIISMDLCVMYLALWGALYLRLSEFYIPPTPLLTLIFLSAPIIGVSVYHNMKVYQQVTRYLDKSFIVRITLSTCLGVLIWSLVIVLSGAVEVPRSVVIMYGVLSVLFIWLGREAISWVLKDIPLPHPAARKQAPPRNVLIYGAGRAGIQLLSDLKNNTDYKTVGLIDDNKCVLGQRISGLKVYSPDRIGRYIAQDDVKEIFIALPYVSWTQKRKIIQSLEKYRVAVKALPAMGDIASGKVEVSNLKPIDIMDLLGRPPVPPAPQLMDKNIKEKAVMVTGAGGSIGSELSRQILKQRPRILVLFDVSEAALYEIEDELNELKNNNIKNETEGDTKPYATEIFPILGSVLDTDLIESTLRDYEIETIYHAAAYKHVPLVEQNPFSGLRNNTFGTLTVARMAEKVGVEQFVLVSTDKAVRPTNIMGASKRLAELILQALAEKTKQTTFTMVRFGNVLDSSGSVIKRFQKQIKNGGPVTVTHPNINRFFMSIPEAAGLVIQAGAMAKGGDVFVLDMGEPIKIDDLARSMISLFGLEIKSNENPEGDIAIEYIGLRRGEKLYEELLIGKNTAGTEHPRIMKNMEPHIPGPELEAILKRIARAIEAKDLDTILLILRKTVEGYQPPKDEKTATLQTKQRPWPARLQTIH
ncbi:MAG: polysaccharide biosynthesis protein [Methyloligellaceae bacterium]